MLREEVEVCSCCMGENVLQWDVEKDGYKAKCQHCGEEMMLCDACFYSDDNENHYCDWTEEGCWRSRTANVVVSEDTANMEDKNNNNRIRISGIIFEHGNNDYGLWEGFSLTEEEEEVIWQILVKHDTEGFSIRGTRKEIADEIGVI